VAAGGIAPGCSVAKVFPTCTGGQLGLLGVPYFCPDWGQRGGMIRAFIFGRIAPLALILGPIALGLPAKAGGAFVLGALAGLAVVLPFALVLRLIGLRQLIGWPFWLLGIALRMMWRRRLV